MNEISRVTAAPPASDLEAYYAEVRSFQATEAARARRSARAAWGIAGAEFCIIGCLAVGMVSVLPLIRVVPVFLNPHQDGSVDATPMLSALPPNQQEAVKLSALWQYVMLRESYSGPEAQYNYDVVSGMSSPDVRRQYQDWFNAPNPASPQVQLGQKGTIRVSRISGGYVGDPKNNTYRIAFWRVVTLPDSKPGLPVRFEATVQFAQVTSVPLAQRITFNPGALIVTSYPGAEQEGGL